MQDPSLSFHRSSLSTLPSSFTFHVDAETLNEVVAMAERFAPIPRADYSVIVQFTPGSQQWIMEEHNCVAWIATDGMPGPQEGAVIIPLHFLQNATILFSDSDAYAITVDTTKNIISCQWEASVISTTRPLQESELALTPFVVSSSVTVSSSTLLHLGSSLATCPIDIGENPMGLPLPFTLLEITLDSITASRDWKAFGGARTSFRVEASGNFEGLISYFPDPMNREMLFNEVEDDDSVTLSFSIETPNIAVMSSGKWGMRFELGFEAVFHYRPLIEGQLVDDGMNVEIDERIGWNPTIQVRVDERLVDIDIVPGLTVLDATLRASTVVLVDAPWTLEMASEVNAWNDQWASVKLVYQHSSLYAVCDFPVSSIEHVSELVRDLAAKTTLVDQVIGVFL